jgi:anti-anti-sigma factor
VLPEPINSRMVGNSETIVYMQALPPGHRPHVRNRVTDLYEVDFVDSSGLGELVRIHTTLRKTGGQMKLVSLSKKVQDLLQMTSMNAVFDIQKNEASAIRSFDQAAGAIA